MAGRRLPFSLSLAELPLVLTSLLVCPILLNILFFAGLARGAVGPVNSLRYSAPLWAVLFTAVVSGVLPNFTGMGPLMLIAAGITMLLHGGGRGDEKVARLPLLLALASGASQGGAVLLAVSAAGLTSEELLLYQNVSFLLVLTAWSWWRKASSSTCQDCLPIVGQRGRGMPLAITSGLLVYVIMSISSSVPCITVRVRWQWLFCNCPYLSPHCSPRHYWVSDHRD